MRKQIKLRDSGGDILVLNVTTGSDWFSDTSFTIVMKTDEVDQHGNSVVCVSNEAAIKFLEEALAILKPEPVADPPEFVVDEFVG